MKQFKELVKASQEFNKALFSKILEGKFEIYAAGEYTTTVFVDDKFSLDFWISNRTHDNYYFGVHRGIIKTKDDEVVISFAEIGEEIKQDLAAVIFKAVDSYKNRSVEREIEELSSRIKELQKSVTQS